MEKTTNILDTREYNKELLKYAEENGWIREELKLSKYIYLEDPETGYKYPDWACGDGTNDNIDGIIELKSYSDWVGSTTGGGITKKAVENKETGKWFWVWMVNEGVYHLQNQCIKMEATGLPYMIIVYGKQNQYQSDDLVLSASQKTTRLQGKFRFGLSFVKTPTMALKNAETFLKDATEMPRRYVNYNLFKGVEDEAVNALCGFTGFGPEKARRIIEMYSLAEIGHDANTMNKEDFIKKYAKKPETKVPDLGPVGAGKLYVNFKFKGPQLEPVKGVDYQ